MRSLDIRRFAPVWLRDNCDCAQCRDPQSGQKLFTISDLPDEVTVGSIVDNGTTLSVQFEPDGHRSTFTHDWLARYDGGEVAGDVDPRTEDGKWLWPVADIDLEQLTGSWSQLLASPQHRARCLEAVVRRGLVILRGVPVEPDMVLRVAGEFGFVRETNYGRLFDVRVTPAAANLAFTARAISPHTDNPYRDPVPTVQLLHCLVDGAEGGDSGLVDGFAAAALLRERDPAAFACLTRTPVTFRYRDETADLSATAPLISLDARDRIRAVRFNNRSTMPLALPYPETVAFYAAYRSFASLLNRPEAMLTTHLTPGDCLIFDNTRVLHARTAFSAAGPRHLQGCYSDLDAFESQLRLLATA